MGSVEKKGKGINQASLTYHFKLGTFCLLDIAYSTCSLSSFNINNLALPHILSP